MRTATGISKVIFSKSHVSCSSDKPFIPFFLRVFAQGQISAFFTGLLFFFFAYLGFLHFSYSSSESDVYFEIFPVEEVLVWLLVIVLRYFLF